MEVARPEFRPDPSLDREAMETLQREVAAAAVFADDLSVEPPMLCAEDGAAIVAGIDQGFHGDDAVSAVIAIREGEVIERASAVVATELPYIPGLLAFREAPAVIEALEQLECEPDCLLIDGSGRIHYRQAGLATHIGVTFDMPAVGVIKNLLCGAPRSSIDKVLPVGRRIPIDADETVEGAVAEPIGYALQTRQFAGDRHINPVFVSPGHRIGAEAATDVAEGCCSGYKLPEPIRLADRAAADLS